MMSRKKSFFEFWRKKKERGALLERANQRRLLPSQQKWLLGDYGVRAALQGSRVASLLPPVGTEVFRRFTPASLEEIQQHHEAREKKREDREKNKEVEKGRPKPASDLEAGKPLPFFYGDPPPELLNTPLEELDPFYQSQKTFMVLGRGNIIHRFNAEASCYLLSLFNPLRTFAIKALTHSLFSLFILVTLLINCVFMTMSDPPAWSRTVEYVFTVIYTSEVIIKVVSRGFCVGKFTFLRDPWNCLDIIVIITAYLSMFVDLGKFSVLMMVPRVLKILPLIPGMKTTIGALVQSLKRLAGVAVVMLFFLSLFAVLGLQMFMGTLKQKCVINLWSSNLTTPDYYYNESGSSDFDFDKHLNSPVNHYFLPHQLDALLCGNSSDAGVCPEGYICLRGGSNPNYGYTSYDSFGWSLLSHFRLMVQDFWDNLFLLTLRAAGKGNLTYFVLIVFPGSFFLLALVVAVVTMASSEREEAIVAAAKRKEKEFSQILEVLKRREEEEQVVSRAAPAHKQDGVEEFGRDQRSCPPCWLVFAELVLKWNCCDCWRWLKQRLYTVIMNPFFDLGICFCLILNTLFMAMQHYPMSIGFESLLHVAHLVFTAIFTAEMFFKLVALDPYGYFQVGWNVYDSIIVIISLMVLGLADVEGLSVLSCFLLMRVVRLARWWPSFLMLLKIMWTCVRALRNLTLLLLVMIFIFSVVGMQLFQKDYKDCVCRIAHDCELPRWHMTDFFNTFLVVFMVLFGDWIEKLWDCMEVSGQHTCLIFFMMVLVIGKLLVLNLFLTLLLSSFSGDSPPAQEEKEKNNVRIAVNMIMRAFCRNKSWTKPDRTVVDSKEDNNKDYLALDLVTSDQAVSEVKNLSDNQDNLTPHGQAPMATAEIETEFKTPENEEEKKCVVVQKHTEVQQNKDDEDHKGNAPEDCCCHKCYRCCPFLNIDTSQGTGKVWSNFRRACLCIVQHRFFEIFIIIIIVLSSGALMFEDIYLPQRQVLKAVVETADQVFTYLFLLEMLLKWVAFGLKRYFSDAWCWLDFLILDVFLASLTADMLGLSGLGAVRSLRTLRALAPLRALSHCQGLKVVVVQVLVRSAPCLLDGLMVFLVVWLIFCILGVNLFAGKFYHCFNETSEQFFLPEDVENKSECFYLMMEYSEVTWKNAKLNYDSVSMGYLSLLQLGLSADWYDIMYAAVDSRQVESQPVYESKPYMYLYFICFIIISSFFTFNLLVRGIINHLQRDKFGGMEHQQKYSKPMKKPQKPVPRPQNQCQARLFDLVTNPYFDVVIVVLLLLYMVTRMVETQEQSFEKEIILHWCHFSFVIIFLIEFILKIIALRKYYFKDRMNILDFVLLIVCIAGLFINDVIDKYFLAKYFMVPSNLFMFRLVRIARILHVSRCTRGIRKLLLAFVKSLPALFNIVVVLFLITVTFAIFGMFNFAYVKKEGLIDNMFNFEAFGNSMICLFMITRSAGWYGLLIPIMNTPPDCDPNMENPGIMERGDCGSPALGIAFITTYLVLSFLLVLHMYFTVILEILNSEDTEVLSDDELQMFYETWREFDPDASQFIQYSQLSDFCNALQDRLRIPKPNIIKLIHTDLPLFPGDKIHCEDVLLALAAQVTDDSGEMEIVKARMEEKFHSSKVSCEPISSTLRRKREEVAAKVIQKAYRKGLLQPLSLRHAETTAGQSADGGTAVSASSQPGGASE